MKIKIDVSDGKDVLFISDFHLYHKNVIGFDNRPFRNKNGEPDLEAMHRTIIDNWNKVVTDNDVVFYLGDLCFGRPEWANNIIYALKGTVHYIMGNHDKYSEIKSYNRFASINDYVDLNILNSPIDKKLHFALMHYPIYSWNRAHHGSYMIHGHCHGNLHHGEDANFYVGRRVMDVGCNLIEYTPISYIEIINQLK